MDKPNTWKFRALWAEWAFRWNQTIQAGKCSPEQQRNMEFARSWYISHKHMKPGQAAKKIREEMERQILFRMNNPEIKQSQID